MYINSRASTFVFSVNKNRSSAHIIYLFNNPHKNRRMTEQTMYGNKWIIGTSLTTGHQHRIIAIIKASYKT